MATVLNSKSFRLATIILALSIILTTLTSCTRTIDPPQGIRLEIFNGAVDYIKNVEKNYNSSTLTMEDLLIFPPVDKQYINLTNEERGLFGEIHLMTSEYMEYEQTTESRLDEEAGIHLDRFEKYLESIKEYLMVK